jgi:integrase
MDTYDYTSQARDSVHFATQVDRFFQNLRRVARVRRAVLRRRAAATPAGPAPGVITTATLRDAINWDQLVRDIGQPGLVRHGLRHTALTWMADAGVELHLLQRVAGHRDPAVTSRYLHPDVQAMLDAGARFSAWWSPSGPRRPNLAVVRTGRSGA